MIINRENTFFQNIRDIELPINGYDFDSQINILYDAYNKTVDYINNYTINPLDMKNNTHETYMNFRNVLLVNVGNGDIKPKLISSEDINFPLSILFLKNNEISNLKQFSRKEDIKLTPKEAVSYLQIAKDQNNYKFIVGKLSTKSFTPFCIKNSHFCTYQIPIKKIFNTFKDFDVIANNYINQTHLKNNDFNIDKIESLDSSVIDKDILDKRYEFITQKVNVLDGTKEYKGNGFFPFINKVFKSQHIKDKLLTPFYKGIAVGMSYNGVNYDGDVYFAITEDLIFNTKHISQKSIYKKHFGDNFSIGDIFKNKLWSINTLTKDIFTKPAIINFENTIDWEDLNEELYQEWLPYKNR